MGGRPRSHNALDTLVSTQDTIHLAAAAPRGELLYPDDDHCAMGHCTEWLEHSTRWLHKHLEWDASGPMKK